MEKFVIFIFSFPSLNESLVRMRNEFESCFLLVAIFKQHLEECWSRRKSFSREKFLEESHENLIDFEQGILNDRRVNLVVESVSVL